MMIAGAAAVVVLAIAGYGILQRSGQEPRLDPKEESPKATDQKGDEAKAAAEKEDARRQADEKAAADKREAEATKAAAEQRARWRTYEFPPPNAGLLVYTVMPNGDPACASYNGGACLWGMTYDQIDFSKLNPLQCGEPHRARWGVTGYDDPKHWCSIAKTVRGNPS